jgi:coenzyme Q-binding protein COQ10
VQRHTETKVLPYQPDQLFDLVGDVMRYPEFVPWVSAMRTWNAGQPAPGVTQLDAEAEVRFAIVRERFATRVRKDANERQIDVDLLYGPFRSLHNQWRFAPHPCGTEVRFLIEFAFKSRLLEKLLAANARLASNKIMACFEAEAKRLYAQPSGAQGALG